MRGKVATAATHEVRKHAAAAAQAVAAAREATMELDKVIGWPLWIPLHSCELLQTNKRVAYITLGLNPSGSHGDFELNAQRNKARMGDLRSTWFPVHPTTSSPPHLVGIWWTGYFQPPMWEPGGLPMGEIGACRACPCPFKVFAFKCRHLSSGASHSRDAHFSITRKLGEVKDEATP